MVESFRKCAVLCEEGYSRFSPQMEGKGAISISPIVVEGSGGKYLYLFVTEGAVLDTIDSKWMAMKNRSFELIGVERKREVVLKFCVDR